MTKAGFVTIIGRPNVGKSTLMNTLIGQKIAITSYKPQTTRNQIRTIYTDERGQIVFLDTPGVQDGKDRLGQYMRKAVVSTLREVDVVLWLVDAKAAGTLTTAAANGGTESRKTAGLPLEETAILRQLADCGKPVIIVLTKCDLVRKDAILLVIDRYARAWKEAAGKMIQDIIPVSARTKQGCADLMQTIFDKLPEGEPFYDADEITTQTQRQIAAEIIREKALRLLQEEVPHDIAVQINKMHTRRGRNGVPICDIEADIICEREAHKGIIIGAGGTMIRKIGTAARKDIENMLDTKVNLQLFVKVRKDWKDDVHTLQLLGYNEKDLQ